MSRATDIAWAAGIFEGEGSFHQTKSGSPQAKVKMADRDVVERFYEIVGFGHFGFSASQKPEWSDMWVWRVTSWRDFLRFVDLVGHHLGARRAQRFEEIKDAMPSPMPVAPGDRTHCRHGHEYTPENTRIVRQANGRGRLGRQCRACDRERWNRRAAR